MLVMIIGTNINKEEIEMKPISFPEQTTVFAEEQSQYRPLPAHAIHDADGRVISCWQLNVWERIKLLWSGKIWVHQLTFNNGPLQPQLLEVKFPFIKESNVAVCPHGKAWNDYCRPCGRVNGGGD